MDSITLMSWLKHINTSGMITIGVAPDANSKDDCLGTLVYKHLSETNLQFDHPDMKSPEGLSYNEFGWLDFTIGYLETGVRHNIKMSSYHYINFY